MYPKALEDLIQAALADGVLTDQEKRVIANKAKQLGIAPDEVEVYVEGLLVQRRNESKPQSNKAGTIRKCPNCGAVLGAYVAKCPDCGHEISGVKANSSVKELADKLQGMESSNPLMSRLNFVQKKNLIANFPIPTSKEDFIEFATLCLSHLNDTSGGDEEWQAWGAKAEQLKVKYELLFKNDPEISGLMTQILQSKKKREKGRKRTIFGVLAFIIGLLVLLFGSGYLLSSNKENEVKEYAVEMTQKLESLPVPNVDNYLDCYNKFSKIQWTKSKEGSWESEYQAFSSQKSAYAQMLKSAFVLAGVPDSAIPDDLLGKSTANVKPETEEIHETDEVPETDENESEISEVMEIDETASVEDMTCDQYSKYLRDKINKLPTPTEENCIECYRSMCNIAWDKSYPNQYDAKKAFLSSKVGYAELVATAYKKAGLDLPEMLTSPRYNIDY